MKICVLTQTATDISEEYKEFFRGKDLFFITFKKPNDKAIDFLPSSTWSDGRNRLWELVRDKYDYYIFIDDDLTFIKPKLAFSALANYIAHKFFYKGVEIFNSYEPATPTYFFSRLNSYLEKYKPEVLAPVSDGNMANRLDTAMMRKNSFVRRLGWFDAQCTVLSNYAANKLLPYDTKLSGWWSSQIPIYLYSYNVFGDKALSVSDIGTTNNAHNEYVPNYNGRQDVKNMLAKISSATGQDFSTHYNERTVVDNCYGEQNILARVPSADATEDYSKNFALNMKGIENLLHENMFIDSK